MARPRVVLDALLVTSQPTGVGRSILELLGALAGADRGFDHIVCATEPGVFDFLEGKPGWRVVLCPEARGGVLRKAWYTQIVLPRLCRELGADVLHSLQFVAPLWLSCPSVVTVHDLAWQIFPGTVEQPRRSYYRLFVPPSLSRAAAVVTNSEATAADVRRLHPRAAGKVTATPFGTPSWVWRETGAGQEPDGMGVGRPRFLFVGTLEPRKNLVGLLDGYDLFLARALAAGRDLATIPTLLFVGGKGWRDSELQRRIGDLRDAGHLEVLDYCGIEELWGHYRQSRALVFPSLHEGFGFPILEAMAAGLPVLTAGRGAMAEVAGDAALLADPTSAVELADALAVLAWDDARVAALRAGGFPRARFWHWDRTAECTTAVYESVLAAGRGPVK